MDSLAEKRERIKKLRPIDDVFFEVLADDLEVCQEILRTILEDDSRCNIEVQRANSDNHLKRARYNAGVLSQRTQTQENVLKKFPE